MSTIKYQFGEIDNAAADIRSTSARIGSELEDLKRQLQPMISTWEGESSTAYQAAQAQWDSAALELNTILSTISDTLAEGNNTMSDINRRAAASWQ
ncbi:WXG100 family type VII secretion target [Corynebacterium tapiri]|uniref:ESAT-6-like protein n=1 Tax=Corynebacterium tapiri TaxID=1448266 RepID=A0A5C4U5T4_9CORY|nr:WXG100 family type VII secretion target [Corynebacterium tapiri]TNL98518.1 WXG100 family type VII secretion target [Corynebacterium tapiri]